MTEQPDEVKISQPGREIMSAHPTGTKWEFLVYVCPVCGRQLFHSTGDHPACNCIGTSVIAIRLTVLVKPRRDLIRDKRIELAGELLDQGEPEAALAILKNMSVP